MRGSTGEFGSISDGKSEVERRRERGTHLKATMYLFVPYPLLSHLRAETQTLPSSISLVSETKEKTVI